MCIRDSYCDAAGDYNLKFFLAQGIIPSSQYHYIFVVSGEPSPGTREMLMRVSDAFPNVDLLFRTNFGYDFCAWKEALFGGLKLRVQMTHAKYFILINKSVRGPFLPAHFRGHWPDIFTSRLNDRVRLSGTSVNCDALHVQSMVLAFDQSTLRSFVEPNFVCVANKDTVIRKCEIGLSQSIVKAGFKLASTMQVFGGAELPDQNTASLCEMMGRKNKRKNTRDPYYRFNAGGFNLHPIEMVFFKANRNVEPELLQFYTELALMNRNFTVPGCLICGN